MSIACVACRFCREQLLSGEAAKTLDLLAVSLPSPSFVTLPTQSKNRHASQCNKCRLNFTLARGRQNKMYCLFSLSPLNLKLKHGETKSVWPLQNWLHVFVLKIRSSPSLNRGESRCLLLPHIKSYNSLAGLCGGFLLKQAWIKWY